MTAEEMNLMSFSAYNGWLEKLHLHNKIKPFLKLHGKGGSLLPITHAEIMADIREEALKFQVRNIWNMDESGLFYRQISNHSYLSAIEDRSIVRRTAHDKQKERVTIVLSCNADGSIVLPVFCICHSNRPRCFGTGRYEM